MKISSVSVHLIQLPLIEPFKTGFGIIKTKGTVLTKITTDNGLVGWGESSSLDIPIYTHEWNEGIFLFLKSFIAPQLTGLNCSNIDKYRNLISSYKRNNLAKAGPESALYSVFAQEAKLPLHKYLHGIRTSIDVGESIGIKKDINIVLSQIASTLKSGRKRFKIKIEPDYDIEPLKMIRKRYPEIDLMVDANASYSYKKHKKIFQKLDNFNLTMIEQPFGADSIIDHASLQKTIKTPICLDESIDSIEDAQEAVSLGACKIVNIKPGRVGGIYNSVQINDYFSKNNIKTWCGGMMECTIGKAINLAVASLSNFDYPADMSPPFEAFTDDVSDSSFRINKNGKIALSAEIGLGYSIDEKRIEKYTVKKATF